MIRFLTCGIACALLFASPANAAVSLVTPAEGYTYYNREGATREQHDTELRFCIGEASRLVQPDPAAGTGANGGIWGALAAGIVRGIMQGQAFRRGVVANTTNCMMLHGWRLVQVDATLGEELAALEQPQLAERLSPWIGASDPEGEVVRVFSNEMAQGQTIAVGPAGDLDKMPLSMSALAPVEPQEEEAQTEQARGERLRRPRTAASPRALRERDIAALTEQSTLVVVQLKAISGSTLSFARMGDGALPPGFTDGLPDSFAASIPQAMLGMPVVERTFIFSVPPGRWRINGVGLTLWSTSFCFGAPSFEIAQNEVVFVQLDMTAPTRVPTFSAEAASTALASAPAHVGARARQAEFTNGATSVCGGSAAFYAWEIPDAPFADAYHVGSRAPHLVAAQSVPVSTATEALAAEAVLTPVADTAPAEGATSVSAPVDASAIVSAPAAAPPVAAPQ